MILRVHPASSIQLRRKKQQKEAVKVKTYITKIVKIISEHYNINKSELI